MSASPAPSPAKPTFLERLQTIHLIAGLVALILLNLGSSYVSVRVGQSDHNGRITSLEAQATEAKQESQKHITREEFDARWQHVQSDLREIKEGVREIRQEMRRR